MNDYPPIFTPTPSSKTAEELASLRQLTLVIYILFGLSWLSGSLTGIVAIIINYIKFEETAGTIYQSHFLWLRRTFWWGVLWSVVGFVTLIVGVGFLVLGLAALWSIYRLVKGWLDWNDRKPVGVQQ